ncbi:MAG: peptidoglycan DD-metalloendopeptidase family protein [Nocardioides sp.]|uniref:peptidoglycan DD-metalloendopeptidase family protein n=1 Tax=Nocardioides sp. TaxID=35761 RepID=UPI0039E228D1
MRSFPRAGCRRVVVASVAAITVGALAVPVIDHALVPSAFAESNKDKLKKKRQKVRGQIQTAEADLDDSSNALAAATAKVQAAEKTLAAATTALAAAQEKLGVAQATLDKAETALTGARAEDARMQAALDTAQAKLAQAKTDLVSGRAAVAAQREKVSATMISNAQGVDAGLLALSGLLDAKSPEDIERQQELQSTIVSNQEATYDDLQASEVLLTVRRHQTKAAEVEVAAQRQAAADQLEVVRDLEQQAQASQQEVAARVADASSAQQAAASATKEAASARAVAARQKAHDAKVLKARKAEDARITRQILAASGKGEDRTVDSVDGLFQMPVANSYVTSPYGWRKHPIYGYWGLHDGDDFHAPCGTPEVAVDTGRVISEYFSSVWGNRLFLDLGSVNGHKYTAIYNHISTYVVREGAVVARGDTVALAGTTGWSTACHLHFTILRDGTAIDPQTVL